MLQYTICFIKNGDNILLLNRNKAPNMGRWNGVGGKIEVGETHLQSVIRETYEETTLLINEPTFAGEIIWESNRGNGGMYVYIAELPKGQSLSTPVATNEGILDWKPIDWIINEQNTGMTPNIKYYLPEILKGTIGSTFKFKYINGELIDYELVNNVATR